MSLIFDTIISTGYTSRPHDCITGDDVNSKQNPTARKPENTNLGRAKFIRNHVQSGPVSSS